MVMMSTFVKETGRFNTALILRVDPAIGVDGWEGKKSLVLVTCLAWATPLQLLIVVARLVSLKF